MVSNLLTRPLSWVILALSFKIRNQIWCGYIYGCLIAGRSLIAVCRFVRASSHEPTAVPMFPSVKVWGCIFSIELHWLSIPWCSWLCSMWLHAFWLEVKEWFSLPTILDWGEAWLCSASCLMALIKSLRSGPWFWRSSHEAFIVQNKIGSIQRLA